MEGRKEGDCRGGGVEREGEGEEDGGREKDKGQRGRKRNIEIPDSVTGHGREKMGGGGGGQDGRLEGKSQKGDGDGGVRS